MAVRLNDKGIEKLREIQDKYKFMNTFEIEQDEVYNFCSNIRQAYHLGLCLDDEDLDFIEEVMDKIYLG